MDRRSFLKAASLTGLALAAPMAVRQVYADGPYTGPFFIHVNASGGWDPRMLFDPTLNEEQNTAYTEIGTVGEFSFAPLPLDLEAMGLNTGDGYENHLITNEAFINKHRSRLTVLNGVDTSTNNHDTGRRTMGSGQISTGYPAFSALLAAAKAPESPTAFISGGGYDSTQGIISLTRITNINAMQRIIRPNEISPGEEDTALYHHPDTADRIAEFQRQRLAALREENNLPRIQGAQDALYLARANDSQLNQLEIPENLVELPGFQLNDLEGFQRQAQLTLAAFKAGLAVSANLTVGGFDTHSTNNRNQRRQLAKLLAGVDFIMDEAAAIGLEGKVTIIVTSDFARGPHYNGMGEAGGKDHWPVTTMFALGAGVAGDRVIGATNDAQQPLGVDPNSLNAVNGEGGVVLTPGIIHRALRTLLGVDGSEAAAFFPLAGEDLPLFG